MMPSRDAPRGDGEVQRAAGEGRRPARRATGLHPSAKGKRVAFSGRERAVIDGPFAETKELIAGYWLWQVKSMEEALEWVRRCPSCGEDGIPPRDSPCVRGRGFRVGQLNRRAQMQKINHLPLVRQGSRGGGPLLHTSIFKDSRVLEVTRSGRGRTRAEGLGPDHPASSSRARTSSRSMAARIQLHRAISLVVAARRRGKSTRSGRSCSRTAAKESAAGSRTSTGCPGRSSPTSWES